MGPNFTFVHCADLHLGARFKGMSDTDPKEAERMTRTVFESFSRIVDLALSEKADAMFIAGDAFDEETITPRTRMFLADELKRVGIPVFMVRGNHDPVTSWEESIPFPPNVHVFGTEPEAVGIPGVEGAEVVGASFEHWAEPRNLPSMLRGTPGKFTVACVHCDVGGTSKDYKYSPCTLTDLSGRGVDYWALGHIHKRAVLSQDPWAIYPGNIQGRSFKETGEKGAYVVRVVDGVVREAEFVPTQGRVWYDETVDITGKAMNDVIGELSERISPGSIARLTFVGRGELDSMLRRESADLAKLLSSRLCCRISGIEVRSTPDVDIDARRGSGDMVGLLISAGDSLKDSGKEGILQAVAANPRAMLDLDILRALSEDELKDLVDEALKTVISRMGVKG